MQLIAILQSLALLTLANGAPVLGKKLFGARFAYPLDGGFVLFDGRPLFGPSKTIRGIVISILITMLVAPLIGLEMKTGAFWAAAAMAGDLCSSFVKRRLNLPPSSQALGLDQVPESLLPLILGRNELALTGAEMAIVVAIFFAGGLILSRLLYKVHLRDVPY